MKHITTPKFQGRAPILYLLAAACLVVAGLSWAVSPQAARADGGGWPTETPTFSFPTLTFTPIFNVEPTVGGIVFPPTATFTAIPDTFAQGQGIPEVQITPAIVASTDDDGGFMSGWWCWPVGIVALALVIMGILALRNRVLARPVV